MKKRLELIDKTLEKYTFYRYLKRLYQRFRADTLDQAAGQLAYYLILSLFPFLIFVLMLLSFTPLASPEYTDRIWQMLPKTSVDLVRPIIESTIEARNATVLSISLLLAIWSGSGGFNNLITELNDIFDLGQGGRKLPQRLVAVIMAILMTVMISISLASQVFDNLIFNGLRSLFGDLRILNYLHLGVKIVLPVLILVMGLALMYRFAPDFTHGRKPRLRSLLIGALTGALGWSAVSLGFSFYVNNFGRFSNTYGSLGGMIVLLMWLYLSSLMILIGAEVIQIRREFSASSIIPPIETVLLGSLSYKPEPVKARGLLTAGFGGFLAGLLISKFKR